MAAALCRTPRFRRGPRNQELRSNAIRATHAPPREQLIHLLGRRTALRTLPNDWVIGAPPISLANAAMRPTGARLLHVLNALDVDRQVGSIHPLGNGCQRLEPAAYPTMPGTGAAPALAEAPRPVAALRAGASRRAWRLIWAADAIAAPGGIESRPAAIVTAVSIMVARVRNRRSRQGDQRECGKPDPHNRSPPCRVLTRTSPTFASGSVQTITSCASGLRAPRRSTADPFRRDRRPTKRGTHRAIHAPRTIAIALLSQS